MFENEQKYIIKTADDIRRIQEGISKNFFQEENKVIPYDSEDPLIKRYQQIFNVQDLTLTEQVERAGGAWQLFIGFALLMLPIFGAFEEIWIIIWLISISIGSSFWIFPWLTRFFYPSDNQKIYKVNWWRLYIMLWFTWIPVIGIFFWDFWWIPFVFWWWIFILWCCVTLAIEVKIRDTIGIYKSYLDELPQTHFWAIFDMSLDFYSPTIYPQQVIKIRDSIERVTAQIQQLLELQHRMSDYYQKWFATFWSVFFSKKLKEQMQSFFRNESNQLLIYVNTFSQDLNFWTERHKMELSQLEENIDQQKEETILPEWKLALELSQDRISRLTQEAGMTRAAQK